MEWMEWMECHFEARITVSDDKGQAPRKLGAVFDSGSSDVCFWEGECSDG